MSITFRFAKDSNLIAKMNASIQTLHVQLYPEYFKAFSFEETRSAFSKQLEQDNWFCLVASIDNTDAAYALFFVRDYQENPFRKPYKGIHVDQMCVLPEYKGKGVGKALMIEIEAFAKKQKAAQIELLHWERNEEAKGFYAHLGFETTQRFVIKHI